MSARAVAVIRPAANINAQLAFLYILSGPGQLHAFQYRLAFGERIGDFKTIEGQIDEASVRGPMRRNPQDKVRQERDGSE